MQVIDTPDRVDGLDWDAMRREGIGGVVRYLAPLTKEAIWKVIRREEAGRLASLGVPYELVWEYDANDWLWADGGEHGREAVRQAGDIGYPLGHVIYGACDFDLSASQWAGGAGAYAQSFRDAVRAGGYKVGVYGPWDALVLCGGLGFDAYWQCMSTSFSDGRNRNAFPGAQLRQLRGASLHGVDADINDCTSNFGSGRARMSEWLSALRAAAIIMGGEKTAEGYTAAMGDDDLSRRVAQLNGELYKEFSTRALSERLATSWVTALRAAELVLSGDPTSEGYTEQLGENALASAVAKQSVAVVREHCLAAVEERLTAKMDGLNVGAGPNLQVVVDRIDALEDKLKRLFDALEKAV
jgi:hypothetical protein